MVARSSPPSLRSTPTVSRSLALGLGLAVSVLACGRRAELAEADRVLHAIDAVRESPPEALDARARLIDALEKQQATIPAAAQARDACTKAYRLLLDGRRLSDRVKKGLGSPATVDPTILSDLATADAKIKASMEAMPACETAEADLRRKAR
jgi:hypothetical protein